MARTFAIGDIHGSFVALQTLCEALELRPEDTVVTLGDYVDRGSSSAAVIDYLLKVDRTCQLQPLRGNHELIMLAARESDEKFDYWRKVGGDRTLKSYSPFDGQPGKLVDVPEMHWTFLEERLLPYYETATHFFVHANAYPDLELAEQPEYMLYWEDCNDPARHMSGKFMVCGHNSQKSGMPIANENGVCLDTWAWGSGWLSCLDVESGLIRQANNKGKLRKLWLDELAA